MIFSQIGLLIAALKWLIGLVSLSFVLLLVGLICLIMSSEPVASTEPQIIDYPIQTVKSIAVLTPALKKGKLLFATNCETCHEISVARVVGPGLLGVAERVPDRAWLIKWIKNPSAVLKSGDVYANHMVKAFAPVLMPGFPTLTEKEVKDLIDYIASYKSEETNFVR